MSEMTLKDARDALGSYDRDAYANDRHGVAAALRWMLEQLDDLESAPVVSFRPAEDAADTDTAAERGPLPIERFAKGMVDAALALTNRESAPADEHAALVHVLWDQVPDDWDENDIGILADAIMASDVWRNRHPQTIPLYAMLDVWMALYGTSHPEFDGFYAEHGYAETWARLMHAVRHPQPTEGDYHEGLEEGIKIGRAESGHPQPTEGEPSDADLTRQFDTVRDSNPNWMHWTPFDIAWSFWRAALQAAARVADQEGEGR